MFGAGNIAQAVAKAAQGGGQILPPGQPAAGSPPPAPPAGANGNGFGPSGVTSAITNAASSAVRANTMPGAPGSMPIHPAPQAPAIPPGGTTPLAPAPGSDGFGPGGVVGSITDAASAALARKRGGPPVRPNSPPPHPHGNQGAPGATPSVRAATPLNPGIVKPGDQQQANAQYAEAWGDGL